MQSAPGHSIPILQTPRLVLGPFTLDDCEEVEHLAGAPEVARTTANIPHPYPKGAAKLWIAGHLLAFLKGELVAFAVRKPDGTLIGCMSLGLNARDRRGELGYWTGVPYWNQGFTTEAAAACVKFGFEHCGIEKVYAIHLAGNQASGRVMQKIGMTQEGLLRSHLVKNNERQDVPAYGLLKEEWQRSVCLG